MRRCWVESCIGEPLPGNLSLEKRRPETAMSWTTGSAFRQAGPASMLRAHDVLNMAEPVHVVSHGNAWAW